jgi:Icc-related predicted phosphoesterase
MKLLIASDIHTDHGMSGLSAIRRNAKDADVVIVAGDIGTPKTLYISLAELAKTNKPVVYVLGNHDHILAYSDEVFAICEQAAIDYPNLHLLNDSHVTIDGQRFIGSTLWYNTTKDPTFFDFAYIPNFSNWYKKANRDTLDYFLETIEPNDVVITHHMPSHRSVHPRWINSPYNRFFVCPEAEPIIEATQPKMWIHGHTHDTVDYAYGKTRVVCNPCGYPGENPRWCPVILEI